MKLEKINRLFAAYTSNTPAIQKTAEEKQVEAAATQVQEAVKVAKDFGTAAQEKAEKFERIKAQVQSGTYKFDTREVAKAVIRDLIA